VERHGDFSLPCLLPEADLLTKHVKINKVGPRVHVTVPSLPKSTPHPPLSRSVSVTIPEPTPQPINRKLPPAKRAVSSSREGTPASGGGSRKRKKPATPAVNAVVSTSGKGAFPFPGIHFMSPIVTCHVVEE
jgi:hypothetical protein